MLLEFLKPLEPACVNLTSRLIAPPTTGNKSVTYIARPGRLSRKNELSSDDIMAAVMLTSNGILLPVHLEGTIFSQNQVKKLLDHVYRLRRKIYCIIGLSETVKQYEPVLREKIDTRILYHLMKREIEAPIPTDRPVDHLEIHRLSLKTINQVYQLEKAYQFEEVLVHPERFSSAAHLIYFRRLIGSQTILFANIDGKAIAKAGTNAIGIRYSQIGGVYTVPDCRGRKIARSLMIELLKTIRSSDRGAVLFVKKNNAPAVNLYRNLQFEQIGEYMISYTEV